VPVVHGDATLRRAVEGRLRELSTGAKVNPQGSLPLALELQRTARAVATQGGLTLGYVDRGLSEKSGVLARALARPFTVLLAFLLSPFFEWLDERTRRGQPSFETPELKQKRDGIGVEEDRVDQNGLTHLVPLKPGWYRAFALKTMVYLVTALADAGALTGRLGGIQTIHFARWVALPDRRLLFFSNYDGSWEAYLGEFVDCSRALATKRPSKPGRAPSRCRRKFGTAPTRRFRSATYCTTPSSASCWAASST